MPANNLTVEQQQQKLQQPQQLNKQKMFNDCGNNSSSSSGVSEDEDQNVGPIVKKCSSIQSYKLSSEVDASTRFLSLPNRDHNEKFLRTIIDEVLNKAIFNGTQRENKVLEWTNPEELESKFDMSLKDEADSDEVLLKLANDTIKYSVKVGHPYFVNQLFSCVDPYGFAGQVITDALNPR